MFICVLLVVFLGFRNAPFQLHMQVIQVQYEALCPYEGYLYIWFCHEAWVIPFVGKEQRNSGHFVCGIVVGKLHQWK